MLGKVQSSLRTGMKNLMKVGDAIQNNVFGTVLLSLGLLFRWIGTSRRADNYLSNLDCEALRAMTGSEGESAVMLFGIFMQILKFCGALIVHSPNNFLIAPLVVWVIYLFYNTITPTVY